MGNKTRNLLLSTTSVPLVVHQYDFGKLPCIKHNLFVLSWFENEKSVAHFVVKRERLHTYYNYSRNLPSLQYYFNFLLIFLHILYMDKFLRKKLTNRC